MAADGGSPARTGAPRLGQSRTGGGSGVNRSTPQLDATAKWLNEISGVHTVDIGGISALSHTKIKHGLEKHGRPVTKVTAYMVGRLIDRAQRWLKSVSRPTKAAFWDTIDAEAMGVIVERIANAGGDLATQWAAHPLKPAYREWKSIKYPGKPMGQASGALLRDLRSSGAFAVTSGGKR